MTMDNGRTSFVDSLRDLDLAASTAEEKAASARAARDLQMKLRELIHQVWQCRSLGRQAYDDVVQHVVLSLLRSNPVLREPEVEWTDKKLLARFWVTLRNRCIDVFRRSRRVIGESEDGSPVRARDVSIDAPMGPDTDRTLSDTLADKSVLYPCCEAARAEARAQLEELGQRLFDRIVPEAAERPGPPGKEAFLVAVEDLRAIGREEVSIDGIARREIEESGEETPFARVRNRVEQRHTRARRKLLTHLDDLAARGLLSDEDHTVMRVIVHEELRLRRPGAPRSERRKDEEKGP